MIKVPCKITLTGDKDCARNFIGAAQSQLRILESELDFQNLKQGTRRTRLDSRTTVDSSICFNLKEVKIYSEPFKKEEEEIEEELLEIGRFFAKVRRGGLYGEIKFYWITFTKDRGGNIKISANSAGSSSEILGRMSATPYTILKNTHAFTKSFMLKNDDDVEERWIAAPHLLVKEENRKNENGDNEKILTEVFNPLGYPYAQSDLVGEKWRYYPTMSSSSLPFYTDKRHPYPPNRFYCNVAERKMVWYSCYSVMDYAIPAVPVLLHYCFGIVLTLTDSMISEKYYSPRGTEYQKIVDSNTGKELIKTFSCRSCEVDSEGFDSLWYYSKPDPECPGDPMCGALSDMPSEMISDINYLDNEKLEVFLPWGERPIKFTVDLTGTAVRATEDDHTYEAVNTTNHWYWSKEGFEQKLFADLVHSHVDGGVVDYSNGSVVSEEHSGCTGDTEADCSPGCPEGHSETGKVEEVFGGQWERIYWRKPALDSAHLYTAYDFYLPSGTISMKSWDKEVVTVQGKYADAQHCYSYPLGGGAIECRGPYYTPETMCVIRYVAERLKQKLSDSLNAEWCNPNVVFAGAEVNRIYTDAFREEGNYSRSDSNIKGSMANYDSNGLYGSVRDLEHFSSALWGVEFMDECGFPQFVPSLMPYNAPDGYWGSGVTSSGYFRETDVTDYAGDPFVSAHMTGADPWRWKRYGDINTLDEPLVLQYRVDGEGSFSSQEFNRTYYLDDRSSVDSEGLLAAARGAEVAGFEFTEDLTPGNPIFNVARWGVVYKFPEENTFVEVTDELLRALGCNVSELIELGLI